MKPLSDSLMTMCVPTRPGVAIAMLSDIDDRARGHFADRRTGTAFGEGRSQVGLTLAELLGRER